MQENNIPLGSRDKYRTAVNAASETLALVVPLFRSLAPLCFIFVSMKWLRFASGQGLQAACRRGLRQAFRVFLSLEIWFAVYTYYVAQKLQRPRWKPQPMRGDKLLMLRKIMDVMDVVFGEPTGRMRRPDSLNQLQVSMDEARQCVSQNGDILHAESLLRHWAHDAEEANARGDDAATPGSACSPVVNPELAHAQLVQLKRAELSAWFKGAPFESLRRGDFQDLVACSFYSRTTEEVRDIGFAEELDLLVDEMLARCEYDISDGISKHRPMRVTMDPIAWTHRPFLFYVFTDLSVKGITFVAMRYLGFQHYCSGSLGYWYRPGSGAARVFCHGVGLGVLPYIELLRRLVQEPGPFFAIELEAIAMRIQQVVPSHNEVAANIHDMLHAWGFESAYFIGHSFGTVVLAWVAKIYPQMVRRASFLDPVVFLLCNPMVCFSFMYKQPQNAVDKLMKFFVSSELYMANMLSRHFVWHECLLWEEDLLFPDGVLVVLSGSDPLVPSHEVRRYLAKKKPKSTSVVFLDGAFHGEFLVRPDMLRKVVSHLC